MVSNPFKKTSVSLDNDIPSSSTSDMQQNSSEQAETAVGTPVAQSLKSAQSDSEKETGGAQQPSTVNALVAGVDDGFPHGSKLMMIMASLLLVNLLCALDQTIVAAAVSLCVLLSLQGIGVTNNHSLLI